MLKALEKDRGRRYETANGLLMDIQRHLQSEPILAHPAKAWERAIKWAKRRPAAAMALGVFIAASLACGVLAFHASKQTKLALRNAQKADLARRDAESHAHAEELERRHAQEAYSKVADTLDQMELSKVELLVNQHKKMAVAHLAQILRHSPSNLVAVARLMDTLCRTAFARPMAAIQLGASVSLATFSSDSRQLATASHDNIVQVWHPVTGEPLSPPLRQEEKVQAAFFSHDAQRLVTIVGGQ